MINDIDISVIIVNYNVKYFLEQALISLRKASAGIEVEYIVVDNNSTDGSVDYIRENFPEVQLIVNQENCGFGKANNQGLKIAKGKYLLILNPDTVVGEKTLIILKSYIEEHPEVSAIGPKIIDREGQFEYSCRRGFPTPFTAFSYITGLSSLFPKSRTLAKYKLTYLDPDIPSEVDALAGSFMLVRREVYEFIGGFDEDFFMYGEDLDWCYRMKQCGWRILYYPRTEVIHYKGESALRSNIDTRKAFYHAMWLFVKKHFSSKLPLTLLAIKLGIYIAYLLDWSKRNIPKLKAPLLDLLILNSGLIFGRVIHTPDEILSKRVLIPYLIYNIGWVVIFAGWGIYNRRKGSVISALLATVSALAFILSFTYFFKQFAYSRFVLLLTGILTLIAIPGWRWLIFKIATLNKFKEFFKRRTILVGMDEMTERIALRSQKEHSFPFKVIGFIECGHQHLGQKVEGLEVIGSMEDLNDIIKKFLVEEVVFSSKSLSYGNILKQISLFDGKTAFKVLPETALSNENGELPFLELGYRSRPKIFTRLKLKK